MKAVTYERVGGPDVLQVSEVPDPSPREDEVVVGVVAAGINPYDAKIVGGDIPSKAPFPRRVGSDLAGVVTATSEDAKYWDETPIAVGDKVFGSGKGTLAERCVAKSSNLARIPDGLGVETAGSMNVPALTGLSVVATVPVGPSDTVLVGGASGAVGMVAAQLAVQAGARVLGTAGERNHDFLRSIGVEPVLYGPGLVDRVAELGPITAVMDCHGREALDVGVALGVPGERMVATNAYDVLEETGAQAVENDMRTAENLSELGRQVADGTLVFRVVETFSLEQAADGFRALRRSHAPGKIVVCP